MGRGVKKLILKAGDTIKFKNISFPEGQKSSQALGKFFLLKPKPLAHQFVTLQATRQAYKSQREKLRLLSSGLGCG